MYKSRFDTTEELSNLSYIAYQKQKLPSEKVLLASSLVGGVALSTLASAVIFTAVPYAELSFYAISALITFPTGASIGVITAAVWRSTQKAPQPQSTQRYHN